MLLIVSEIILNYGSLPVGLSTLPRPIMFDIYVFQHKPLHTTFLNLESPI